MSPVLTVVVLVAVIVFSTVVVVVFFIVILQRFHLKVFDAVLSEKPELRVSDLFVRVKWISSENKLLQWNESRGRS